MENNSTNPTDPIYQSKVYKALKDNLEGFNKTEQEFIAALKDKEYQKNVYRALKDNLQGFDKTEKDFYTLVSDTKPTTQKKIQIQVGFPIRELVLRALKKLIQRQAFQR